MDSAADEVASVDLERGLFLSRVKQNQTSNLLDPLPYSTSAPALVLTASGKRIMWKQVKRKHYDIELHLAAQRGDLAPIKRILDEINSQMVGADFDAEVSKIRASVVNEVNELGETALYKAAEKGHLEVVKELLKYSDKETLRRRSHLDFDALHIASSEGHHAIAKLLVDHDVSLCQTRSKGNATPLITAALKGHTAVVNELLSKDPTLLDIPRSNGKNALHLAARSGHVETVKSLLEKDPQLARRTDKKGQTALHMAVKGASSEVVKLLLVHELFCLVDTNVNSLTSDLKTALDIAEGLTQSKESADIRAYLVRYGAVRAKELNQPLDELRNTVTQIKNDVHTIAKQVRKLHRKEINNHNNSVTVAVLFAAIAFAAIFTVPGGHNNDGMAVVAHLTSFKIFFIFNAIGLYSSLAVVVIHMTLGIRGVTKAERRKVVEVISKLMWIASVCASVAFMASSYIVVGQKHEWLAVSVSVFGGIMMLVVLGTMMYYVIKWARTSATRRKKIANPGENSSMAEDGANCHGSRKRK